MKQCTNCRGNLADFVAICPYCGVSQPVPQAGAPPEWAVVPQNSNKAIASLVCGVLFLCAPASIAAVILGHLALVDIKRSAGRMAGQGMAIAGLVTGYLGIAFTTIYIVFVVFMMRTTFSRNIPANETAAAQALRSYNQELAKYAQECPNQGYPPQLAYLPVPAPRHYDCPKEPLRGAVMGGAVPTRRGYTILYYPARTESDGHISKYIINADPLIPGKSGVRHFFTDETGVIRFDKENGATPDSEPLQ